ncbi:protein kinase domain-containing protein [Sorangium sp. So ce128]|uniref:protein kinase domain-containing protein n=1 Tax=Sorangium sp. So ce128 TaxID=3133281 RepID=UPI003F61787F
MRRGGGATPGLAGGGGTPRGGTGRVRVTSPPMGPAVFPEAGAVFAGSYRVLRPLGGGGMGAVYVVEHITTGAQRALKILRRELCGDERLVRLFQQEARIGHRISSDHVVDVIDAGVAEGTPWLVMELLQGETLAEHVRHTGPLPHARAAEILAQVAHALAAAHAEGVVHRDVKPENVFIAASKRQGESLLVKLLDFGVAKVLEGARLAGTLVGSPLWMAPEQLTGAPITPSTDVWALGLLTFWVLTGTTYWSLEDRALLRHLIEVSHAASVPPASACATRSGRAALLPPGFDAWFTRCVAPSPQARFAEAGAAFDALRSLLRDPGAPGADPTMRAACVPGSRRLDRLEDTIPGIAAAPTERAARPASTGAGERVAGSARRDAPVGYLAAIEKDIRHQPLGVDQEGATLRLLEEVYVELRVADRRYIECADRMPLEGKPQTLERFLDLPAPRCFSVLGEPGSGKSTLLKHLALARAERTRGVLEAGRDPGAAAIPVLIRLAELDGSGEGLLEYVERTRGRLGLPAGTGAALAEQAAAGRVLFLLDGLDEVPGDRLDALLAHVRRIAGERAWLDAGCRVVVTSRPFGYQMPAAQFAALELLPLTAAAQRLLLDHWLSSREISAAQIDRIAAAIQSQQSLRTLAGNPFLLTLMALVALEPLRTGAPIELPARRAQLLGEAIDHLLRGRPRASPTAPPLRERSRVRQTLEQVALDLLRLGAGPYELECVLDALRASDAFSRLARARPVWDDPEALLGDVAQATGIMIPVDAGRSRWRFQHRALQERLAAAALHSAGPPAWQALARQLGRDSAALGQWAETFALLSGERGQEERLLRDLADVNPDLAIRALGSAGDGAVRPETLLELVGLEAARDAWEKRRDVIRELAERVGPTRDGVGLLRQIRRTTTHGADLFFVHEALESIAEKAPGPAIAAAAREELSCFFDHLAEPPDLGLELVELPDGVRLPCWCEVTGLGPPFKIGRVPVTNALYERFDPDHRIEREFVDRIPSCELDHHPVVNVTWYEAEMFCLWLSQRNPGVRLPSEEEWEYAATQGTGREFPWGLEEPTPDLANFDEHVGCTTRVGAYAKGAGPVGTLDQSGNVWEWCLDAWNSEVQARRRAFTQNDAHIDTATDTDVNTSDVVRVVRGGSWARSPGFLAAHFRFGEWAWYRHNGLGFRCLMPAG